MRAVAVVAPYEGIERNLLLQHVGGGRPGRVLFEREVDPLMAAVLLGMPRRNALELNAEPEPSDGEFAGP